MEEIYENVDSKESQNQRGKNGRTASERRCYGVAVLGLGLLSVFLLFGLLSLGVHYHDSIQSSSAERDLLNASITEMTQELGRLQLQHHDSIQSSAAERDLLNASITEMTKELERLQLQQKCPVGWTMFSCSCYFLSTKSDTWDKGREDCRNTAGADLVVIDSHKEEMFLSEFTKRFAWIGLTDRREEGTWEWIDGTPLTVTYWTKPQPDNGGGDPRFGEEDCAHIRNSNDVDWNDRSCEASLQWICEKNIT